MNDQSRKKIAIIGAGISGLAAASILHPHHEITVYEKNDYIGGHSRTIEVSTKDGTIPVDTGFIVFNKRNYPLLTRLFEHFQVPVVESDMSFGASIDGGWLEYGTQKLSNIFAQKRNLLRPSFWGMVSDILKFNSLAGVYLSKDPSFTLGDCLDDLELGPWFRDYFLLAMGGAIWSTPVSEMLKFPACTFIRFFENHGLLTVNDHPQWYTVRGGSREYVRRLTEPFKNRVLLNCGVKKTIRDGNGVIIEDLRGEKQLYDDVVFACHADQALAMIADASSDEKKILSAFRYQPNRAVLHSDISFMPKKRQAWASWVYLSEERSDKSPCVSLSYWMNNLQPLETEQPLIVTLNPGREPDPSLVYNDYMFEHPVFDAAAINNQHKIDDIQGYNRLWFCGAYQRYGFHEDGLGSAVKLTQRMGIDPPW
ncbi:MAG: FAD-dependent oxidoreductase [Alphaproteobacteria bacterium]|nr:FAD-dependent oxidoreductase [Alphaproteobacteria bacterium]